MEKNLLFSLSILLSFLTYSSHTLTHYQNAPNMWEWLGQTQIRTQPESNYLVSTLVSQRSHWLEAEVKLESGT